MAQDEAGSNFNGDTDTTIAMPTKRIGISVELPIFLVKVVSSLSGVAASNILLYRTCVHSLEYSVEECKPFLSLDSNETRHIEAEVQQYATAVGTVRSIIEALLPAILCFFLGVWSDNHGRKPLIVWPLLGIAMSAGLMVGYSALEGLGPWWLILVSVPTSLSGGLIILYTGAFCYLSDISSAESRSLRMTLMQAAIGLGTIVGALLSSPVLRLVGNVYLLLIAMVLNVIAFVYAIACLRESLTGAKQGGVTSILELSLVKEMMRECFKRRPKCGRAQLLFLILANSLATFIVNGLINTTDLEYLFTRQKLQWAMPEYAQFSAISAAIAFLGSFLGIVILQYILKRNDLVVSSIAFVSNFLDYFIRAFATNSWHMYLAASIGSMKGLTTSLIRSFLSKILPMDIAKVFGLMSVIEGLCPLIAPVVYNSLYQATVAVFPGAIYILSSGLSAVCIAGLSFVLYYRRNVVSPYEPLDSF